MPHWTQDSYARAWAYASRMHANQTYGGALEGERIAYINHLASVAMEVTWALQHHPEADGELAVQCALLHDTLEDTAATHAELAGHFSAAVADGVQALSKNAALPKPDQLPDSLARIQAQPREVWMVKLADRIANLYQPPFYWNNDKILSYRDEARHILTALAPASPVLAARLQAKIDAYPAFCRPAPSAPSTQANA